MRRLPLFLLTLGLAVGLASMSDSPVAGARAPKPSVRPDPASMPLPAEAAGAPAPGVISSVTPDTTWFGGTHWDPVDERWEANVDGRWTFDSGVGSSINTDPARKAVGLHATLEGWTGVDLSWPDAGRFARGATCAIQGGWSAYAGLPQAAADSLCYATGQGYGNNWNVGLRRSFAYPGAGNVTFSYQYSVESELGFDSLLVLVDTTGTGAASGIELAGYSGAVNGTALFTLTPGVTLPTTARDITLAFIARSDGSYSDEDGLDATACGLGRVDDITLTGAIGSVSTFETGADGWSSYTPRPSTAIGGDWSDLRAFSTLPPPVSGCALQDTVLVFMDPNVGGGGHGAAQYNAVVSPWIDLEEAGVSPSSRRVLELDEYLDNPDATGSGQRPYLEIAVQWYSEGCTANPDALSRWYLVGYQSAPPGGSLCRSGACPLRVDLGYGLPGARRVRVRLAYTSGCFISEVCAPLANPTPWVDNVRVGVVATEFSTRAQDLPRDAFPNIRTGSPNRLTSPARFDANTLKTARAGLYQSMGDTLVVRASSDLNDIRVNVRVRPGPGIDTARLNAWLATLHADGGGWYSARMDTAEVGGIKSTGMFMTAFHETDPAFSGRDTDRDANDRDPNNRLSRLRNDIFPDDLFTPGTRIDLYYRASAIMAPGTYFALPDTTGGHFIEYEVLPSSITPGLAQNAVLFINHTLPGSRVPAALQAGLYGQLPGGSANTEGVAWDRFDLPWATGAHPSLSSPSTIREIVVDPFLITGYSRIVWSSGELTSNALSRDDEAFLSGWLSCYLPIFGNTPGCGRGLYLTGDALVSSLGASHGVGQPIDWLGLRPGCPGAGTAPACRALQGLGVYNHFGGMNHYALDPALGGNVCGSPPAVAAEGMRTWVQTQQGAEARPNLEYLPTPGCYASVSNIFWYTWTNFGGSQIYTGYHKTVTDGFSAERLRQGPGCASGDALTARLAEVFAWFDQPETIPVTGAPEPARPLVATLSAAAPNPLDAATGTRWQLALPARLAARVAVYDVSGRLIRTLLEGELDPGVTEVAWDGRDSRGTRVSGGLYFVRGRAGATQFRQKLVVRPD